MKCILSAAMLRHHLYQPDLPTTSQLHPTGRPPALPLSSTFMCDDPPFPWTLNEYTSPLSHPFLNPHEGTRSLNLTSNNPPQQQCNSFKPRELHEKNSSDECIQIHQNIEVCPSKTSSKKSQRSKLLRRKSELRHVWPI